MNEEGKNWLKNGSTPIVQFDKILSHILDLLIEVGEKKIPLSQPQQYIRGLIDGNRFSRTIPDITHKCVKRRKKSKNDT